MHLASSEHCVHQLFEAQVARTPEAVAAVKGERAWTYRELNARANQLAWHLRKLGAGPDVPVGVCLPRGLELAATLLAVMKAGGACLPLDPDYPKDRLAYIQQDAQAPVLVLSATSPLDFDGARSHLLRIDETGASYGAESDQNLPPLVNPGNLAYVIYTSGSTGKPRGVLLPHRGLVNHHRAAIDLYGLTSADRVLQSASISFDISVEEMFPAWSVGAAVVFRTSEVSLQAGRFLGWIREQGITVLDLPTAYWHELVHELAGSLPGKNEAFPEQLRLVIVGGEKASAAAYSTWQKLACGRIRWINTYGPTEASVIATAYEPLDRDPTDLSELPIGRPIANTAIYILDEHRALLPDGEAGEMYIAGAGLARGYLNRDQLTAEKFLTNPFSARPDARMYRTGDLGRKLPDGNIEFRGRTDFQVKIRGFRVEPEEIEVVLGQHSEVRQAFVLARDDGSGERRLVAYVVAAQGQAPSPARLRDFLKERLPEYMIPAAFVSMDALPLTPNGKVDRKALAAVPVTMQADRSKHLGARDELESRMVRIWEAVFAIRPIGVLHNFFELGGHSLLALRLMHRIEQEFGQTLPPAVLFQAPSVEQLCDILRHDGWVPRWVSLVPIQPKGSKPPFFCVHGLGGHVMRFGALARHLGPDQPFYGLQSRGLDGKHPCDVTVQQMASNYIEEIRSLQPEGPYRLGGYSFGGAVAYEMARQLTALGQEVGFLVLLDAYPGTAKRPGSLVDTFLKLSPREKLAYIVSKRQMIVRRFRSRIEALRYPAALKRVHEANAVAERAYPWPDYTGRVWLFRASEKGLRGQSEPDSSPGSQWEIHELLADHGSIIREPKVRDLAESIAACLNTAYSPSPALAGQAVT